jgi:hypothetical protein
VLLPQYALASKAVQRFQHIDLAAHVAAVVQHITEQPNTAGQGEGEQRARVHCVEGGKRREL